MHEPEGKKVNTQNNTDVLVSIYLFVYFQNDDLEFGNQFKTHYYKEKSKLG